MEHRGRQELQLAKTRPKKGTACATSHEKPQTISHSVLLVFVGVYLGELKELKRQNRL